MLVKATHAHSIVSFMWEQTFLFFFIKIGLNGINEEFIRITQNAKKALTPNCFSYIINFSHKIFPCLAKRVVNFKCRLVL